MIIATAGHVDHGKTSLVRLLTGIDTDRLAEEKRRGLSIDIGFAYTDAFGSRLAFVDVPGHQRFLPNMLVGVAGIDAALLVVAADDGVMPQSTEHVEILTLLGIRHCVVAINKVDRATPERAAAVTAQARELLHRHGLNAVATVLVSAITQHGLPELRAAISELAALTNDRALNGEFRLAVDRAFSLAGIGTVVTGIVHSGQCTVGDDVSLFPSQVATRVRQLHAMDLPADHAHAGQRVALNLANVERAQVSRGDWVASSHKPIGVDRFVAQVSWLASAPRSLKNWQNVHLHIAADHCMARIRALGAGTLAPGESGLVEVRSPMPLLARRGDRFIIRDASATTTLAGGTVVLLDVLHQSRRPAFDAAVLTIWQRERAEDVLQGLLDTDHSVAEAQFETTWNMGSGQLGRMAEPLAAQRLPLADGVQWVGAPRLQTSEDAIVQAVTAWHKQSPHVTGLRVPALERMLQGKVPKAWLPLLIERLIARGDLLQTAGHVHRREFAPQLDGGDQQLWTKVRPLIDSMRPPAVHELAQKLSVPVTRIQATMKRLAHAGLVTKLADNRYYLPTHLAALAQHCEILAKTPQGLTAATFRDASGIGRNLAVEVLEHFDSLGFTRRSGDVRKVVRPFRGLG